MAEGREPDYSSRFTDSVLSANSLSKEEECDVLIFFHHISHVKEPVAEAMQILNDRGLKVRSSVEATFAAGSLKQERYMANALSSRFKVFVINQSFLKHDLPECKGMLLNGKVCSDENTLFICREKHRKKIPLSLEYVPTKPLSNKVKGSEIADNILEFIDENQSVAIKPIPPREPTISEANVKDEVMDSMKAQFFEELERFDRRRLYVLCAFVKPLSDDPSQYSALSMIPWPKVFDFDVDTDESGLLSVLKDKLHKGRLNLQTQQHKSSELKQKVVNWTTMSESGSCTGELNSHISTLVKFCSGRKPATMLILWYADKIYAEMDEDLRDFIAYIKTSFGNREIKTVLCLPELPEDGTDMSRLCKRRIDHRTIAPLKNVCGWIKSLEEELLSYKHGDRPTLIPKLKENETDEGTFELEQEELQWITADIEILTASSISPSNDPREAEKIHREGVEFLKGTEPAWEVLSNGSFDVERNLFKELRAYILNLVDTGRSTIVTLYHAPGSGGSTLGRQILWSLRTVIPCLAIEKRGEIQEHFKEKIRVIRDNSNLPVLLLLDGRSGQEVRNMLDMCRYERIIILQVLRQYGLSGRKHMNTNFFLPDRVSEAEAPQLKSVYLKNGTAGIKKKMAKLTRDIVENHKSHSVFEYGLTAFNSDFIGIGKYVESHLMLRHKPMIWHRVAAMLSIANYYGNRPLPAEFFANILNKERYQTVCIEDDIPELGQQLIRECGDGDEWKISHYLVAKEILEQYLGGNPSESNKSELSNLACQNLNTLAAEFIQCMKEHDKDGSSLQSDLLSILNNIFITRNHKGEDEDDETKRKPLFSRLITDVKDEGQQTEIFQMLVDQFPANAEFHAHFGRFLAKRGRHDEASKAINKAIAIRNDLLKDRGIDARAKGDDVLQRIHTMFGFAHSDHVKHVFGNRALGFMVQDGYSRLDVPEIRKAFSVTLMAIDEFRRSRGYHCPSVDQSYAFVGEIRVRLQMIEFCKKRTNYSLLSISHSNHHLHFLWDFIVESFAECDYLLDQFISISDDHGMVYREIENYLDLYINYFCKSHNDVAKFMKRLDTGSFSCRRCQITFMKLSNKPRLQKRAFHVIPDLHPSKYAEYAMLLQSVIDDSNSAKITISQYMDDWLKVSRHLADPVSLASAKHYVDEWDKRDEKESFSSFYKYVIQFAITLFNLTPANRDQLNKCAERLKEGQRFLKQRVLEVPIEWYKDGANKHNLSSLRNFREMKQPLQEFFGQVIEANIWSGSIEIQGTKLKIFFVPKKFSIRSYHAKSKQRVRFHIGFNPKRGAQAYDVELMVKLACTNCGQKDEYVKHTATSCKFCNFDMQIMLS